MDQVPITFEHNGKTYNGYFKAGIGAGGDSWDHWHLMINNYYYGALHYSGCTNSWLFHGKDFQALSDYFEAYMVGWFQ